LSYTTVEDINEKDRCKNKGEKWLIAFLLVTGKIPSYFY